MYVSASEVRDESRRQEEYCVAVSDFMYHTSQLPS